MLIWWKTKEKTVKSGKVSQYQCPQCGSSHHNIISSLKYFTLYSLPLFPIKKESKGTACLKCGHNSSCSFLPGYIQKELESAALEI